MSKINCILVLFFFNILIISGYSQDYEKVNPAILNNKWSAHWITAPEISLKEFKVLNFRKSFTLNEYEKEEFIIHVSADNRYRLFVNGQEIGKGPARGDLNNWNFETYDIKKFLTTGENVIAAVVWNFAEYAPLAQITNKTAFIVQGNNQKESVLNTNSSWRVYINDSYYSPKKSPPNTSVGPNEIVDGSKFPFDWEKKHFNDEDWCIPERLGNGTPKGKTSGWEWALIPTTIPQLEYKKERFSQIARTEGIQISNDFLNGNRALTIPANRKVSFLIDNKKLTTAYPELILSKGKGSEITLEYAEALIDSRQEKGHRGVITDKHMPNMLKDLYIPDGSMKRTYQPLWFRTYRYLEISIQTGEEELILEDFYNYFSAYPFIRKASFTTDNTNLNKIWDIGWLTARLCAGETYYDCPYYEQLQYIGDTRIQALISLNLTKDDRLVKNAINQFRFSMLSDGLTQSRYPSSEFQIIPGFSLFWIAMVYDYMMYRGDFAFIEQQSNAIESVLYWFEKNVDNIGMLGIMDYWNFVDWSFGPWRPELPIGGTPPSTFDGNSSVLSLLYVYALQKANIIFTEIGNLEKAAYYNDIAVKIKNETYELCWDASKGLLADSPSKTTFSQHANALGILVDIFPTNENKNIILKALNDKDVLEASLYFKYYVFKAANKSGLSENYVELLEPWVKMINMGLSTFSEKPEPTRSDCHAWSAHPLLEFVSTICGIRPLKPGFKKISIEPSFGSLNEVTGIIPHPKGEIKIELKRIGKDGVSGYVEIPYNTKGQFIWKNQMVLLNGGRENIEIR